jgi:DNA (cytosine-5)-methyltransferase 1
MRFADLFAGLGGFHIALKSLGHECVFASEIDGDLSELYEANFGVRPAGDIRKIDCGDFPEHDVLCAGFPCQPFSKAGEQRGTSCERWGGLFDEVMRVVGVRAPRYIILENVYNLARHNGGATWARMKRQLETAGYTVDEQALSPHQFGIPQVRRRLFVVASLDGLDHFRWPKPTGETPSIRDVLDDRPGGARRISLQVEECLGVWQDFLDRYPATEKLPSFPIWSMEFGATYPFRQTTPYAQKASRLRRFAGPHGKPLADFPPGQRLGALPSYARAQTEAFPDWKVRFIQQNRDLYARHQHWIDEWLPSILAFPPSLQKFEWNCQGEERDVWQYVVQFRASGVRVKRPTTAPSLVAMTTTQVPIIAWEKRYMTPRECSRLQSMGSLKALPTSATAAYRALGNAVNADVVRRIAASLCGQGGSEEGHGGPSGRPSRRSHAA